MNAFVVSDFLLQQQGRLIAKGNRSCDKLYREYGQMLQILRKRVLCFKYAGHYTRLMSGLDPMLSSCDGEKLDD